MDMTDDGVDGGLSMDLGGLMITGSSAPVVTDIDGARAANAGDNGDHDTTEFTWESNMDDVYPESYKHMASLMASLRDLTAYRDEFLARLDQIQENGPSCQEDVDLLENATAFLTEITSQMEATTAQLNELPEPLWQYHEGAVEYEESLARIDALDQAHRELFGESDMSDAEVTAREDALVEELVQVEGRLEGAVSRLEEAYAVLEGNGLGHGANINGGA